MNEIKEEDNEKRFVADAREYKFKVNGSSENVGKKIQQRSNEELVNAMKKYMPIGSIVKIGDSFKNYMIMGFNPKVDNKIYDYLACEYPFGLDSNHQSSVFNHNQIEKIFHIGFVNNQEKSFKSELLKSINNSDELEK